MLVLLKLSEAIYGDTSLHRTFQIGLCFFFFQLRGDKEN
jgi:hypothetical protein